MTSIIPRNNQVETLIFDTGSGTTRTFDKEIHVNIDHPNGFFIRQVNYRSLVADTSEVDVLYVDLATGNLEEQKDYVQGVNHTATPVIVRNNSETEQYSLHTNLVNYSICAFQDGTSVSPNTFIRLTNNVDGNYTFRIDDSHASPSTTAQGILTLVLEFVKY